MTQKQGELLLASVIVARAASYAINKVGLESMGMYNMLAVRFLLAFFVLAIPFYKRFRGIRGATVARGALLGAIYFAMMAAELTGQKTTDTSTAAFLENIAIVVVPLMEALIRRRLPGMLTMASAGIAFFGVGLMTMNGGALSFTAGELFCLVAAMMYVFSIMVTDRFSRRDDPFVLGMLQVGFLGLYALVCACLFEVPRLPANGREWMMILMLALVCTGFGYTLQPVAQSHTRVERAGLLCALSPVFASLIGAIFLHERMTPTGLLGAGLILMSLFLPNLAGKLLRNSAKQA